MAHFTPEQKDAWLQNTAESPFNRWLDAQVKDAFGTLQLERLYAVAMKFGIDKRAQYAHLNPGQQRMNIGNMLRKVVPQTEYVAVGAAPSYLAPQKGSRGPQREVAFKHVVFERPDLITESSIRQLLEMYSQIMDELKHRGVVRTTNAPGGDYAELLFSRAFGWKLAGNSASGHDAIDDVGIRYQVKSRRLSRPNTSRQLSALRKLPERHFDYLAGVLFQPDYSVFKAAIIPHDQVVSRSRYADLTKSWTFFLDDHLWSLPGVRDVTKEIAAAASMLN
jgi:hypothetical protein